MNKKLTIRSSLNTFFRAGKGTSGMAEYLADKRPAYFAGSKDDNFLGIHINNFQLLTLKKTIRIFRDKNPTQLAHSKNSYIPIRYTKPTNRTI